MKLSGVRFLKCLLAFVLAAMLFFMYDFGFVIAFGTETSDESGVLNADDAEVDAGSFVEETIDVSELDSDPEPPADGGEFISWDIALDPVFDFVDELEDADVPIDDGVFEFEDDAKVENPDEPVDEIDDFIIIGDEPEDVVSDDGIVLLENDTDDALLSSDGSVSVCKLTTGDGCLLYKDAACMEPAVFDSVEDAVDYVFSLGNTVFVGINDVYSPDSPIAVQMLVSDYSMTRGVTVPSDGNIVFKTASVSDADSFTGPYDGSAASVCTIHRGTASGSLFTNNGTMCIEALQVSGEGDMSAGCGGIIYAGSSAAFTSIGGNTILTGGCASQSGGTIYVDGGDLHIQGSSSDKVRIEDFRVSNGGDTPSDYHGGAIYYDGSGRVLIENTDINGHVSLLANVPNAHRGGAIYFAGGTLELDSCNFYNCSIALFSGDEPGSGNSRPNTEKYGGAIYCDSRAMNGSGWTVQMENCHIDGHYNGFPTSIMNARDGGGVYMMTGNLLLENTIIEDCLVFNKGAGVYNREGSMTVLGSSVRDCTGVDGDSPVGGGIYNYSSNMLVIENSSITGNYSKNNGGGVYTNGDIWLKNTTVSGNAIRANGTEANAGGIYIANGHSLLLGGDGDDTSYLYGNTAGSSGSGDGSASNVRLSEVNGENSYNSVIVKGMLSENAKVGVVNAKVLGSDFGLADEAGYLERMLLTSRPDQNPDRTFEGDSVHLYGRAEADGTKIFFWYRDMVCKITDADGNFLYLQKQSVTSGSGDDGHGETVYIYEPAVYASLESSFSDLSSKQFYDSFGTAVNPEFYCVKMMVSEYELETGRTLAVPTRPFMLTTASSDVSVEGMYTGPYDGQSDTRCVIRRSASSSGSMFSVPAAADCVFEDVVIDGNNKAVFAQGGILNISGSVVLSNGAELKNGNTAASGARGGAVYVGTGGSLSMDGSVNDPPSIHDCVGRSGGGVYVADGGSFTMDGYSSIYDCRSVAVGNGGNGGAVYLGKDNKAADFEMRGYAQISDCTAAGSAGGVYVEHSNFSLRDDAAVIDCTAATSGGGVFTTSESRIYISGNPMVTGNAARGGTSNIHIVSNDMIVLDGGLTGNNPIGVYGAGNNPTFHLAGDQFGVRLDAGISNNHVGNFRNDRENLVGAFGSDLSLIWVPTEPINISVTKTVVGEMGNRHKEFDFVLYLDGFTGFLEYVKTVQEGGVISDTASFVAGSCVFSLAHGESIVFMGIPWGTEYSVTEVASSSVGYVVEVFGNQGVLTENLTVDFTNTRCFVVPTGVFSSRGTKFLCMGFVCAIAYVVERRKRSF